MSDKQKWLPETGNRHLNTFRSWRAEAEKTDEQIVENNLTRAFAICLMHHGVFRHAVLDEIIKRARPAPTDLEGRNASWRFDLETEPKHVGSATLVGVTVTANLDCPLARNVAINRQTEDGKVSLRNRIDMVASFGGVAIVFEMKRDETNAVAQLTRYLTEIQGIADTGHVAEAVPMAHLPWQDIMSIALEIAFAEPALSYPRFLLRDFYDYLAINGKSWRQRHVSFAKLLSVPKELRDDVWVSKFEASLSEFTIRLSNALDTGGMDAEIDEDVFSKRNCIRLAWKWAKEVNVRAEWSGSLLEKGQIAPHSDITGIAIYLTVGDSVEQMNALKSVMKRNARSPFFPLQRGSEWHEEYELKLGDAYGRGVAFYSISLEDCNALWQGDMLRMHKIPEAVAEWPFPTLRIELPRANGKELLLDQWKRDFGPKKRRVLNLTALARLRVTKEFGEVIDDKWEQVTIESVAQMLKAFRREIDDNR